MSKVERFEDLKCWQAARELVQEVYVLCSEEPLSREYRLRDQLTSASVSVMTNIAEGFARYHRGDFIRFLDIAQSSAVEVKSLLYVVLDQQYASAERVEHLQERAETTKAITLGLLRYVNQSRKGQTDGTHEPTPSYGDGKPVADVESRTLPNRFLATSSSS
jgi:four helix bundle protein